MHHWMTINNALLSDMKHFFFSVCKAYIYVWNSGRVRVFSGSDEDYRWGRRGTFSARVLNSKSILKFGSPWVLIGGKALVWKVAGKGEGGGHSSWENKISIFMLPHFFCCCVFFIFQEPFQVKVASEALLIMDLVRIIYCVYLVILICILVYFYCRHKREYGRPVFWILTILFYKESKNKSFLLEKSQTLHVSIF